MSISDKESFKRLLAVGKYSEINKRLRTTKNVNYPYPVGVGMTTKASEAVISVLISSQTILICSPMTGEIWLFRPFGKPPVISIDEWSEETITAVVEILSDPVHTGDTGVVEVLGLIENYVNTYPENKSVRYKLKEWSNCKRSTLLN